MIRTLLVLTISLVVGSSAPSCRYGTNLATASVYWGAVLSNQRLPFVAGKGIVSTGPFFIDINHRESALLIGPLVVWANGHKPEGEPGIPLGKVDLTNKRIKLNVTLEYSPRVDEYDPRNGGRIVFWFQSRLPHKAVAGGDFEMPDRTANYVYNQNLLPDAVAGRTAEIALSPDLNQWTCLGNNPIDTRPFIGSAAKYTCALNQEEFAQAMAQPGDMGVLFLLPSQKPEGPDLPWLDANAPARTQILGKATFILKEFIIER